MVSKKSMWKGMISFGLLNIPVKMVTMREDKQVHFHNVRRSDGSRIKMQKVAEKDGQPVSAQDIALGYDAVDGTMVILEKAEIESAKPESDKKIKIDGFTDLSAVDMMYLDGDYILVPDTGAADAYSLLLKVFEKMGKAGMARITIRQKEHPALVHAYKGGLVLSTLKYVDEVVVPSDLEELKNLPPVEGQMFNVAMSVVETLNAVFDPANYKDNVREKLLAIIEAKKNGQPITMKVTETEKPATNLMAALQATLAQGKQDKAEQPTEQPVAVQVAEPVKVPAKRGRKPKAVAQ